MRLQIKLSRDREIRQRDAEQYLIEKMDGRIKWTREELMSQARLPLLEFIGTLNQMQAKRLIEVKQDSLPRHYSPHYSLTNLGRQRARHTSPRS